MTPIKAGDIVSIHFISFDPHRSGNPAHDVWLKAKVHWIDEYRETMCVRFINGEAPERIGEFYNVAIYEEGKHWRFEKSM